MLAKKMSLVRRSLRRTEDGMERCLGVKIIELNSEESLVRRGKGRIRTSQDSRGGQAGLPTRPITLRILLIHQSRDRIFWRPILLDRDTGGGHPARLGRLGARLHRHPLHPAQERLRRRKGKRHDQPQICLIDPRVVAQQRGQLPTYQADLKAHQIRGFVQGIFQTAGGGQQIRQILWCQPHDRQPWTLLGLLAKAISGFLAKTAVLAPQSHLRHG